MKTTAQGHSIVNVHDMMRLIREHAATHRAHGYAPVFCLDVDGLLMDNRHRTLAILRELVLEADIPWFTQAMSQMTLEDIGYGAKETVRGLHQKYGFDPVYTSKVMVEELANTVYKFWFDRFFTNEYQVHDVPIIGALRLVQELRDADIGIVYVTGRDEPGMGVGFRNSLQQHGFPLPGTEGVRAILKPKFEMKDPEFKKNTLELLQTIGMRVIGLLDDNTHNVNIVVDLCNLPILYVSSSVSTLTNLHPGALVLESFTTS